MMRLVKNELIKLLKQRAYRVVLIVMLAISLLVPLIGYLGVYFENEYYYSDAEEYLEEYVYECADYYADTGIEAEYYSAWVEAAEWFAKTCTEEWKYQIYCYDYEILYLDTRAAKLVSEGKYTKEELAGDPFYYEPEETGNAKQTYDSYVKKLKAMQDDILYKTERSYIETIRSDISVNLNYSKSELEKAKKSYDKNQSDDNKYDLRYAEVQVQFAQYMHSAVEIIYENSCSPIGWECSEGIYAMQTALNSALESVPLTPKEYSAKGFDREYSSYLKYVERCEQQISYYDEVAKTYLYSVQSGVPIKGVASYTKLAFNNAISSSVAMMSIFFVVIAAGMVAKEFSSGTIRLLLIRPRSRAQIIFSKITALAIVYAAVTFVVTLIMLIEVVLLYGVGDLFVGDLVTAGDGVLKVPSIVGTLRALLSNCMPVLSIMAMAMLLSALGKKSGLGITLSIVLMTVVNPVIASAALTSLEGNPKTAWLAYTPLPYLDMGGMEMSAATDFMHSYPMHSMASAYGLSMWIGVLYHLAFVLILSVLTVIVFKKSQVKS